MVTYDGQRDPVFDHPEYKLGSLMEFSSLQFVATASHSVILLLSSTKNLAPSLYPQSRYLYRRERCPLPQPQTF